MVILVLILTTVADVAVAIVWIRTGFIQNSPWLGNYYNIFFLDLIVLKYFVFR